MLSLRDAPKSEASGRAWRFLGGAFRTQPFRKPCARCGRCARRIGCSSKRGRSVRDCVFGWRILGMVCGHRNLKKPEIQFWIYGQKTGTSEAETTWKNLYSKPIIRGNHKAGRDAVRVFLLAGMREAAGVRVDANKCESSGGGRHRVA